MSPAGLRAVDRITQEALALPDEERAELVRRLARSLDKSRLLPGSPSERRAPLLPASSPPDEGTTAEEPDDDDPFGPIASW
jgi:hypothetical protein